MLVYKEIVTVDNGHPKLGYLSFAMLSTVLWRFV